MQKSWVIARRELSSFFHSPIAYVALLLFLLACGLLFWRDFTPGKPAEMRRLFEWMIWLLVFIAPVLSMGLLAGEWASGTIEPLMTAPLREWEVVVGKFLGALMFLLVLLAPTLVYVALLRIFGRPDFGPIFTGYLGIVLVGALFTSVGLFCSSLTRSQVVAAVAAAGILFLTTIVPAEARRQFALDPILRAMADQTIVPRYTDFARGVLDTGNLVFFIVATGVFLFLTTKVLESRRWK